MKTPFQFLPIFITTSVWGILGVVVTDIPDCHVYDRLGHHEKWNFFRNTLDNWSDYEPRCWLLENCSCLFTRDFALVFSLGCDVDSCYRGRGHACCYHRAEQLLRLGLVCRGLPAQQQPADHRGGANRLLRCHPVIHHVCGKRRVRKGMEMVSRRHGCAWSLFCLH